MKRVSIDDQEVTVRARVEKIDGFSAHADSDALVNFVEKNGEKVQKVFVAMGETGSSSFLAQRLHSELGVNAVVPESGKTYLLN
jgi:metallo-beta-lactamase family protein